MFQAQGAESNQRPPPLPPAQKAICYNSDGLTKPEMDAASQNLYHPKGKCLLNHREPEESGGRGAGTQRRSKGEDCGGGCSRPRASSHHGSSHHPNSRGVSDGGKETGTLLHSDICRVCIHTHICVSGAQDYTQMRMRIHHTDTHTHKCYPPPHSHVLNPLPQFIPRQKQDISVFKLGHTQALARPGDIPEDDHQGSSV